VLIEVAAKVEGLEKALTLATTSREWNRKRVVELEDELERMTGDRPSVRDSLAGQVVRLEKSLAESRELVTFKERVADQADEDKDKLFRKLEDERDLVKQERTRANNLARRVAELERSLAHSIDRENVQEGLAAESRRTAIQTIAARDRLLAAATTRVRAAKEILGATAVGRARDEIVTSKGAVLADAIGNALDALSA
jgi:hypothetical protein